MVKLERITISGMHNVDKKIYDLFDLNYFTGPNGTGKSTILEAIQLALLGYIPGKGKQKEQIFLNANGSELKVSLSMRLTSEFDASLGELVTISRSWIKTTKGIDAHVQISPEGWDEDHIKSLVSQTELPIFNFNEFAGMTANKLKDWFISFIPKTTSKLSWETELKDAVVKTPYYNISVLDGLMQNVPEVPEGVEGVRAMNDYMKAAISFSKSQLSRFNETIQSLVHYDEDIPVANEEEIRARKQELSERFATVQKYKNVAETNDKIHNAIQELSLPDNIIDCAEYQEVCERVLKLSNESPLTYENDVLNLNKDLVRITTQLNEAERIIKSGGICQYSGEVCPQISNQIGSLVSDVTLYRDQIIAIKNRLAEISEERDRHNNELSKLESIKRELERKYDRIAQLQSQIMPLPQIDPADLAVDYSARIAQMDDLLIKILANKRYDEMMDVLVKDKYRTEIELEYLKIWDKLTGANGLQSSLMSDAFDKFATTITGYLKHTMGDDITAAFNITEKANSFTFGIDRSNTYIPYELLSSGEKCLYMLALMMTIVSASADQLKLVMVDDMLDHLDDENISRLFKALDNVSSIQFIFAGIKDVDSTYNVKLQS